MLYTTANEATRTMAVNKNVTHFLKNRYDVLRPKFI
jgi:hypothetical protein